MVNDRVRRAMDERLSNLEACGEDESRSAAPGVFTKSEDTDRAILSGRRWTFRWRRTNFYAFALESSSFVVSAREIPEGGGRSWIGGSPCSRRRRRM